MRLTNDEREKLRTSDSRERVRVWRFSKPTAAIPKHTYRSNGELYTIHEVREITAGKARQAYKKDYTDLKQVWPLIDAQPLWLVVIERGDWTDKPRFMQPTGGKSGDYTNDPKRGMKGEPQALSEVELRNLYGGSEKLEAKANESKSKRRSKQRKRKAIGLLRKAVT